MPQGSMVGTRIRERRLSRGLRQIELARRAGISASYLNLIEHNRRRIGGKTLLTLAEALGVEPSVLSEGAEAGLLARLREAAGDSDARTVELDRIEEFAGRFPGWAQVLADQFRRTEALEQTVQTLTDRMAHDPHLAASLHEVISTVTAIRSAASILADTKELEPEWRIRFNRNINEDSQRLAEGAEHLVRYLEAAPDADAEFRSPQDELHAFLLDHDFHFPELEDAGDDAAIARRIDGAPALVSETGRHLARDALQRYLQDARDLPGPVLDAAICEHGLSPVALGRALKVHPACLFRRLASLPSDRAGPVGLVICDASGSLLFRKPVPGFALPRASGGCTLWPLFEVLGTPRHPVQCRIRQAGREQEAMMAYAVAEEVAPPGFEDPARHLAHMLVLPDRPRETDAAIRKVGITCRVCSLDGCAARREPSIIAKGF